MIYIENDSCNYHLDLNSGNGSNCNMTCFADFLGKGKNLSTGDLLLEILLLRISSL